MKDHHKINYVEFGATDLPATKRFFSKVFGWEFVDYGPDYAAFSNQGIDGGFCQSDLSSTTEKGGALLIFYSRDIEASLDQVEAAGGKIVKSIFDFPGGCRFNFIEPSGNEFAIWSDPRH
jgi:uncharacterized protein